jgi:hypothetical protein
MEKIEKKNLLPITVQEAGVQKKSFSSSHIKLSVFVTPYNSSSDYFNRFHRPISKIMNFE